MHSKRTRNKKNESFFKRSRSYQQDFLFILMANILSIKNYFYKSKLSSAESERFNILMQWFRKRFNTKSIEEQLGIFEIIRKDVINGDISLLIVINFVNDYLLNIKASLYKNKFLH
ncbi:hypothetical protein AAJ76_280001814 [Vairimorpha ceranae]|uniref:Uncharacterized protein n=1 Tax=Vairimorpha ceranae TaxID=40302 RepID=A0A0F9YRK6_9MICR|nr:hypothetical protein AAJ76_280001814 [Vairimorpha ceranae]KKO75192.1 hypothetical protein AAJ76_280001814 [Vairimorpha ceranae]